MERESENKVAGYCQKMDYYHIAKLIRDEGIDDDEIIEDTKKKAIALGSFCFKYQQENNDYTCT